MSGNAPPFRRFTVVGGGAWGTALAAVARRSGHEIRLWARETEVIQAINATHENPVFLAGITLDPAIRAVSDLAEAADCDAVLLVVPAQFLGGIAAALRPHLSRSVPVILCAKGIEQGSLRMMTEVAAETFGPEQILAVLSGPTFAAEVAKGLPTAVTLACAGQEYGEKLAAALGAPNFRPYLSDDLIGAEIGGAVKNVLAIACGIVAGKRLGENARASLITRGLAEMARLALAKGARAETLMGLSGMGDLVLTCTSTQSRNHSLGIALGEGRRLDEILGSRRSVAEGVASAASVAALAARLGVEMPIVGAVDAILHRGADLDDAIGQLLARPFRREELTR